MAMCREQKRPRYQLPPKELTLSTPLLYQTLVFYRL